MFELGDGRGRLLLRSIERHNRRAEDGEQASEFAEKRKGFLRAGG